MPIRTIDSKNIEGKPILIPAYFLVSVIIAKNKNIREVTIYTKKYLTIFILTVHRGVIKE